MSQDFDLTRLREVYNQNAAAWAARASNYDWASNYLDMFRKDLAPPATVLALGCGYGPELEALQRRGYSPVGVDLSDEMVSMAVVSGYDVRQGDMRKLPFEDDSFDGVWASASFLHVPKQDIRSAFAEVRRVLGEGGTFCASFKKGDFGGWSETKEGERYFTYFHPEELSQYLQEAGLDTVDFVEDKVEKTEESWLVVVAKPVLTQTLQQKRNRGI